MCFPSRIFVSTPLCPCQHVTSFSPSSVETLQKSVTNINFGPSSCGVTWSSLPCGAAGSSGFDADAVSTLNVSRGAKKVLVGTASAGQSCGRTSEEQGCDCGNVYVQQTGRSIETTCNVWDSYAWAIQRNTLWQNTNLKQDTTTISVSSPSRIRPQVL